MLKYENKMIYKPNIAYENKSDFYPLNGGIINLNQFFIFLILESTVVIEIVHFTKKKII